MDTPKPLYCPICAKAMEVKRYGKSLAYASCKECGVQTFARRVATATEFLKRYGEPVAPAPAAAAKPEAKPETPKREASHAAAPAKKNSFLFD